MKDASAAKKLRKAGAGSEYSQLLFRPKKSCLVPITLPYLVFVSYPKVFLSILLKNELFLPKI